MNAHIKDADLVIEGGMVITMAEGQAPISNGRVLIKDGIIADIQSRKEKVERFLHREEDTFKEKE